MMPTVTSQQVVSKSHHKSFTYRMGNEDRNYFFANEKMTGDTGLCGMILTVLAYILCIVTLPISAFMCVKVVKLL